jgi:hypothetical protein
MQSAVVYGLNHDFTESQVLNCSLKFPKNHLHETPFYAVVEDMGKPSCYYLCRWRWLIGKSRNC